MYYVNIL